MKRLSSRFFRMCGRVGLGLVVGTLTACGGGGGGGGTGGGYEDALAPSELAAGSSSFTITFDEVPVEKGVDEARVSLSFTCTHESQSIGSIESCNIDNINMTIQGTWEHNGGSVGNELRGLTFKCSGKENEIQVTVNYLEITGRTDDSAGRIEMLSGKAIKTKVSGIVSGTQEYIFNMSRETELNFTIKYTYN